MHDESEQKLCCKDFWPAQYAVFIFDYRRINILFLVLKLLVWFGLVWFYGTSTIKDLFMPNPSLYIETVLFQTIQFSICTQFKCQNNPISKKSI